MGSIMTKSSRDKSWAKRALLALVLSLAIILGGGIANAGAVEATTGSISGTVTLADGGVIPEDTIYAYANYFVTDGDGTSYWSGSGVPVGTDGTYRIGNLADGDYRLYFSDYDGVYLTSYYPNAADLDSADDITVAGGEDTAVPNVALTKAGSISGTVALANEGVIPEDTIYAYAYYFVTDATGAHYWLRYDSPVGTDGTYRIGGLAADTYLLEFCDNDGTYLDIYYPNATDRDSADEISVGEGENITGKNVTLTKAGSISGTVSLYTGDSIPEDTIYAYANYFVTGGDGISYWSGSGVPVGTDGTYRIGGLAARDYRLNFNDKDGTYFNLYYPNATDLDSADDISVAAGDDVTVDNVSLKKSGSISGTLTGTYADNTELDVLKWSIAENRWNYIDSYYESRDEVGSYRISGLNLGKYLLVASSDEGQYRVFNDGSQTIAGAQPLVVREGGEAFTVNIVAEKPAEISDESVYKTVNLIPYDSSSSETAYSDNSKVVWLSYSSDIELARAHLYKYEAAAGTSVRFSGPGIDGVQVYKENGTLLSELYFRGDGVGYKFSETGTYYVAVMFDERYSFKIQRAGSISGKVLDKDRKPLVGGSVDVFVRSFGVQFMMDMENLAPIEWVWYGSAGTLDNGSYSCAGITSGVYKVRFSTQVNEGEDGLASEWYNDVYSMDEATTVEVSDSNLDIVMGEVVLSNVGSITGHVVDTGRKPVAGISVRAYPVNAALGESGHNAFTTTNADGEYALSGLLPKEYKLLFTDDREEDVYHPQYYRESIDWDNAATLTVTTGEPAEAQDLTMYPYARVSGRVVDGQTRGIKGISAILLQRYSRVNQGGSAEIGWAWVGSRAESMEDGAYSIDGLTPGIYKLLFDDTNDLLASSYYKNGTSFETADDFEVVSGENILAKTVLTATRGSITGVVTDVSGVPLEGVNVGAHTKQTVQSEGEAVGSARTDSQGRYTIRGLDPEDYSLHFYSNSIYARQIYNDTLTWDDAEWLTVTAGDIAPASLVKMRRGATLTGRVETTAGAPIEGIAVRIYTYNPGEEDVVLGYLYEATTDAAGLYSIDQIPAGSYKVSFSDENGLYAPKYYGNTTELTKANTVAISDGEPVSLDPVALSVGATISGTVFDEASKPMAGICVSAWFSDSSDLSIRGYDYTDADGNYSITGMPDGEFVVSYYDYENFAYESQYYGGVYTYKEAERVTISGGLSKSLRDVTLWSPTTKRTVTFDSRGGSTTPLPQTVLQADRVAKPADPTINKYEFAGWYTDPRCTKRWDFANHYVRRDMTLYAGWTGATTPVTSVEPTRSITLGGYEATVTVPAAATNLIDNVEVVMSNETPAEVTNTDATGLTNLVNFDLNPSRLGSSVSSIPVGAGYLSLDIQLPDEIDPKNVNFAAYYTHNSGTEDNPDIKTFRLEKIDYGAAPKNDACYAVRPDGKSIVLHARVFSALSLGLTPATPPVDDGTGGSGGGEVVLDPVPVVTPPVVTPVAPVVATPLSANATLKKFKVSKGTLSPKFSAGKTKYKLTLKSSASSVKLTAYKAFGGAKVMVSTSKTKGFKKASSYTLKLKRGKSKTVYFKVYAQNGSTKLYSFLVKRK